MRESEVERQFVEAVRAAGGQALKFTSQSMNGVPDRLVLLLGGKCAFVELKAPGKQMRLLQRKRRQQALQRRRPNRETSSLSACSISGRAMLSFLKRTASLP